MLGVTATQSEGWHWDADASDGEVRHAPTLAAAPEGLSARRVERWLELPPGAWQKRRLFALRVRGQAFAHLGYRSGDLVVVEPGAREQADSVVVTRSAAGLSLKKISKAFGARDRMPTVLELPLRERAARPERVVGTLVGHLRETGTGALRPVGAVHRASSQRASRAALEPASRASRVRTRYETVLRMRQRWRRWIDAQRSNTVTGAEELERWERLDASLGTLCDCLSRTHSAALRGALLEEAAALVSTIHSEMRR